MMTQAQKRLTIWSIFGTYLAVQIAKGLKDPSAISLFDWALIVWALIVIGFHYSSDRTTENREDSPN